MCPHGSGLCPAPAEPCSRPWLCSGASGFSSAGIVTSLEESQRPPLCTSRVGGCPQPILATSPSHLCSCHLAPGWDGRVSCSPNSRRRMQKPPTSILRRQRPCRVPVPQLRGSWPCSPPLCSLGAGSPCYTPLTAGEDISRTRNPTVLGPN